LDAKALAAAFRVSLPYSDTIRVPHWNCAPTQYLPIIRQDADGRHLEGTRWGWRRPFTKAGLINAKGEDILTKTKIFRKALAERRCIVPASHFYEWQPGDGKSKQPFAIGLNAAPLFAMAGLWEDERDGDVVERCHVVCTIDPNELMQSIHGRQPLILTTPEQVDRWLNPASEMAEVVDLIKTTPAELMHAWKVSQAVGSVKNNGPELAQPT